MTIERKRLKAEYNGNTFEIAEDKPEVGAYLYAFISDGRQFDYLQNSIVDCQEFALEEFNVPILNWFFVDSLYL